MLLARPLGFGYSPASLCPSAGLPMPIRLLHKQCGLVYYLESVYNFRRINLVVGF